MPELLADPEKLARHIDDLEAARRAGPLPAEAVSALAECAFRIAVHPSTAAPRALELLQHAVRLDRANPKYHYHIARLCFRHGELDAAAQWLERARQLCPTSHRIWVHIGLLQREINDRYRDAKHVPDEHLRRWREIAEHIRGGHDAIDRALADFKPKEIVHPGERPHRRNADEAVPDEEEPPPRRLLSPGTCRWTPIDDLLAEDLLESEAGERKRNELREPLERAAARATRDRSGSTFVILAVEWLLRGYAPAFIHRLRPRPTIHTLESILLLDRVLLLIEADPATVPARLAEALEDGTIPPLLAAAIHRLHLFGAPPSLNKLAADLRRAAQWSGTDEEEAQSVVRSLEQGARSLESRPRGAIADFSASSARTAESTPAERVAASAAECEATREQLQSALQWMVAHKTAEVTDDVAAEAIRIRAFVLGVKDLAAKAVAALRASGNDAAPELVDRLKTLETDWQGLTAQCGPLMKLMKRYPEPAAARPSAEVQSEAPPPLPSTPLERLKPLAADLEAKLRAVFDRAAASFDVYSSRQRRAPPLQAVRLSIRARKAETLYRLGRRDDARREWNALLVEDRLSLDALRNVAVCDSRSGNVQRCLDSWRDYTEMLYFHAVGAGDPARLAAERVELHRNFGNAYAPRVVVFDANDKSLQRDHDEVQAFLSSPAAVRLFMRHRLLALLAERLDFRTPPLILGVTRTEGEAGREAARAQMEAWTARLALGLPRRAGPKFAALVSARLARAAEEMKSVQAMTALAQSAAYAEEHQRYLAWLRGVAMWKFELHGVLQHFPDAGRRPGLLEPLVEFAAADQIPMETSTEMAIAVTRALHQPEGVLARILSMATSHHVASLLRYVFPAAADSADAPIRARLYQRLTVELDGHPVVADANLRALIDDPGVGEFPGFYPDAVRSALEGGAPPSDAALTFLRDARIRYPRSAGIACHYALLLAVCNRRSEAIPIVRTAMEAAFSEAGRQTCTDLLAKLE